MANDLAEEEVPAESEIFSEDDDEVSDEWSVLIFRVDLMKWLCNRLINMTEMSLDNY